MSKYNNRKVTVDGRTFDSAMEADYYLTLKQKVEDGILKSFICQPKFKICDEYVRNGKKIKAAFYVLDFQEFYVDGRVEYVDVKGFETDIAKLKRKLLESKHPNIRVKWLTRYFGEGSDEYGWIEKEELEKIIRKNRRKSKKILDSRNV